MTFGHIGSWGLPDFGITEAVGSVFGSPRTTQGGSNLTGSRGQVLGSETIQNYPGANPYSGGQIQGPVGRPTGYQQPGPGGAYPTSGGASIGALQEGQNPQGYGGSGMDEAQRAYQAMLDQKYNELTGNIDRQLGDLGGQRTGQEQIVQNAADQVGNTLTNTYQTNKGTIEQNQSKNLNELSDYLQQAWQQGNNMLGVRGASDSSAANQYSYALAKQGSQQRGDIMQQTQQLQTNLKTAYDTEMQNNELEKQNKMLQISQWFSDAQNQLKGMKSEMSAQKSEEALNYALQLVGQAQQVWAQNKSTLDQWATSKAQSLGQLTQMLNQNSQNMPTFQGLNTGVGGGQQGSNLFGFRNTDEQKNGLV